MKVLTTDVRDAYFQYSKREVPNLRAKVEKKGKETLTIIINMTEVAEVLGISPTHVTKYFASELKTKTRNDFKKDHFAVTCSCDEDYLNYLLDHFIWNYMLCAHCYKFDTELQVLSDQKVTQFCKPCEKHFLLRLPRAFIRYVGKKPGKLMQEPMKIVVMQKASPEVRATMERVDYCGHMLKGLGQIGTTGNKVIAILKYIESSGSENDHGRHGRLLWDILLTGSVQDDEIKAECGGSTDSCLLRLPYDMANMTDFVEMIGTLTDLYKIPKCLLALSFEKILGNLKACNKADWLKLACVLALLLAYGYWVPSDVQNWIAVITWCTPFVVQVYQVLRKKGGITSIWRTISQPMGPVSEGCGLKSSGALYSSKQAAFGQKANGDGKNLQSAADKAKQDLLLRLDDQMTRDRPVEDIVTDVKQYASQNNMHDEEVTVLIWETMMSCMDSVRKKGPKRITKWHKVTV